MSGTNDLSLKMEQNILWLKERFSDCDDFIMKHWHFGPHFRSTGLSVYLETLTPDENTNRLKSLLQDLVEHEVGAGEEVTAKAIISFVEKHGVSSHKFSVIAGRDAVVESILNGQIVILLERWPKAIAYDALSVEARKVDEPIAESVVQGPREGAVENLATNIGLIRSRLRNDALKMIIVKSGGLTRTKVAYSYMQGIVPEDTLAQFEKRFAQVKSNMNYLLVKMFDLRDPRIPTIPLALICLLLSLTMFENQAEFQEKVTGQECGRLLIYYGYSDFMVESFV